MWNRKDVKAKGKAAFKNNFWKCVVTALIIAVIGGGASGFSSSSSSSSISSLASSRHSITETTGMNDISDNDHEFNFTIEGDETTDPEEIEDEITNEITEQTGDIDEGTGIAIVAFSIILFGVMLVLSAIGIAISALLFNPLRLGCQRFFRKNLDEPANMSNIVFAFDSNYKNVVKTMFLRDIYVFLWSLLFVIPGIIKSYEYRMVPYLLSENPGMSDKEAFAESKRLMNGNKWKTFVLDLSFIGWDILSLFTCGILNVFYVNPYKMSTEAALYEALKYGTASAN